MQVQSRSRCTFEDVINGPIAILELIVMTLLSGFLTWFVYKGALDAMAERARRRRLRNDRDDARA